MVRFCQRSDTETICAVINDAALAYKGVIPDDRWHEPYMSLAELEQEISRGVEFWGFEKGGQLVGVMGMQRVKDVTLIRHAYVQTAIRNQGIGGKLLAHLLKLADGKVLVGTWKAATWAVRFYEKFGFQLVSEEEKNRLLGAYWHIPQRQIETSAVLVYKGTTTTKKLTSQIPIPAGAE